MDTDMNVYISSFGPVVIGPKFARAYDELQEGLSKRKSTKAYRVAAYQLGKLDTTVDTLASVYFSNGDKLRKTP